MSIACSKINKTWRNRGRVYTWRNRGRGEIGVASTHCTKTDISPSQLQPLLMSMADFQDIQV